MKKLVTYIAIGSLMFSGAAIAQDHTPIRAQDGTRATEFGVPLRMRDNQYIQDCVGTYRESRAAFSAEMVQLRQRLANAADADKAAIKEQIRQQLKTHRAAQAEFRGKLRGLMREVREQRLRVGPVATP